jgi:hypothetical protein
VFVRDCLPACSYVCGEKNKCTSHTSHTSHTSFCCFGVEVHIAEGSDSSTARHRQSIHLRVERSTAPSARSWRGLRGTGGRP